MIQWIMTNGSSWCRSFLTYVRLSPNQSPEVESSGREGLRTEINLGCFRLGETEISFQGNAAIFQVVPR